MVQQSQGSPHKTRERNTKTLTIVLEIRDDVLDWAGALFVFTCRRSKAGPGRWSRQVCPGPSPARSSPIIMATVMVVIVIVVVVVTRAAPHLSLALLVVAPMRSVLSCRFLLPPRPLLPRGFSCKREQNGEAHGPGWLALRGATPAALEASAGAGVGAGAGAGAGAFRSPSMSSFHCGTSFSPFFFFTLNIWYVCGRRTWQ